MKVNSQTKVFVQGPLTCIDFINPETGRSQMTGETLEQVQVRYPGAEIAELGPWCDAKEKALCTAPEPITEDRFMEMLEVLPPQRWQRGNPDLAAQGIDAESFELSEHTSGRITLVCVRIGDDYFQYQTVCGQHLSAHIAACQKVQVAK